MKLKDIKDPEIAKNKFASVSEAKQNLSHSKWVEFVNFNLDYFIWFEDTEEGVNLKNNIEVVPDDFKENVLYSLSNTKAYAEKNQKKGYYEVIIYFSKYYGIIHTTFQKEITKPHLRRLLDLANYLDAYLLNNGQTIITEKMIEELE